MVYVSSGMVGPQRSSIFPRDYRKNLEAERSFPISWYFLFDNWRQGENQKEIVVCDQRQRNRNTDKTIFVFALTLAARNKYLGLIKRILFILRQYKIWRRMSFSKKHLSHTCCQEKIYDCLSIQNRKGKISTSPLLVVSPI